MISAELRARLLVAAGGIPVALLAVYWGGWFLGGFMALVAALATHEFYLIASARGGHPLGWLGIPAASLLVLLAAHEPVFAVWGGRALALLLILGLLTSIVTIFYRRIEEAPLLSAVATVSGALYTGGTLSFAVFLRHLPETQGTASPGALEGPLLVLLPLLVTWAGDSAAYFTGRKIGRTRLAPRVSPGKTVEGGIAGLVAATVVGTLAGFVMEDLTTFPVSPVAGGAIGLALGVAGQLGDLTESLFKREAGVKDSGTLLPGHGGALDRFDALFFAIPLAYGLILLTGYL